MTLKKLLLILIHAVLVCAIGATALIFFSPGCHTLFGWHWFNINGTCMIYDVQAQEFREDMALHVHECQRAQGEVRKGQFVVEDYLDVDALDWGAEEGTFYGHASYYGIYGDDSLNCVVQKYMTLAGREPETVTEDVYPFAVLKYDKKQKVCVVTLYKLNENGEREDLYVVFYGFANQKEASAYYSELKQQPKQRAS